MLDLNREQLSADERLKVLHFSPQRQSLKSFYLCLKIHQTEDREPNFEAMGSANVNAEIIKNLFSHLKL